MKKVLSLTLAILTVISMFTICTSALTVAITEDEAKEKAAAYVGTTVDKLSGYSCTPVKTTIVEVLGFGVDTYDYDMTFRANGVKYTMTVDAVGSLKNYKYDGNGIKKPVTDIKWASENDALASALDAAGVVSSDSYVYSQTFEIKDYTAYYNFSFYGRDCDVTAKVFALTATTDSGNVAKTEKNVIIIFFLKLFAKIKNAFGL